MRFLPGSPPTSFRELTAGARTRMEVVVHFLGLLELYKQGLVELEQASTFGELRVAWTGGLSRTRRQEADGESALPSRWRATASAGLADLEYQG